MLGKQKFTVKLEPIKHEYIHQITGEKFVSVTRVLSSIEEEFDTDNIAESIANQKDDDPKKNKDYIGMTKDQLIAYWQEINDAANEYGTHVHEVVEKYLMNDKWYFPDNDFDNKVIRGYDALNVDEGITIWPERVLFSEEYKLAGTTDLIVDIDDVFFDVGDWKGLPIDTPIFTDSGWKTMGSINVGDNVYDMNGELTPILHTSKVNNKKCYKINFDNNESIVSDFEHRWLISFYRNKKYKDVVITTEELFNYVNDMNNSCKRWSHKIPKVRIAKPLQNNFIKLPIDPYVLGIWLGDGNKADTKITNMRESIWLEIEKRGYKLGPDVSQGRAGKAQTRTIFNIHKEFSKLNLLFNKHIPDIYLHSSYEQRLDMLRGFMDSDGYYNNKRKRFVMTTTQKWQVTEFIKLISSLGLKGTILPCKKKCNGKIFDAYEICFSTDNLNPFLSRNQDCIEYTSINNKNFKNIVSVELVDSVPTRCVEVKSDTHTFLYGHTFSITHNTNKKFNYFSEYKKTLKPPFNHLQDCQFVIYTIQLSTYALMYEMETGRKCRQIWIGYWNKETCSFSKINLMYMKHEAEKLLKHHKYQMELAGK